MREWEQAARAIAASTAGVTTRRAASGVGLHGHRLVRTLRGGEWLAVTDRVLVIAGAPATFERDAWIGLHDNGDESALSHDTALAVANVPGFTLRPIHLTRGRDGSRTLVDGIEVHRSRLWLPHHRLVRADGLRIATPTRALFDIANAGELHPKALERAINNAWARRLTSGELLSNMADEWCERGRRGSTMLREYLESRPIGWRPPESNVERRFIAIVTEAGMPPPLGQRNLGSKTMWIGRVDVCDPELPLVAEIDSDLFHAAPLDAESDAERDRLLTASGFRVERFTEHEIWYDRTRVIERWQRARSEVRAALRRSA
jgi:hypothetical protein